MTSLNLVRATVAAVLGETEKIQLLTVRAGRLITKAINYLELGNKVTVGQPVRINTTAVDLALGSGGYHFVLPETGQLGEGWGHLMKLRYTPLQMRVNSAEEQDSPWHKLFLQEKGLEGVPVLAAELHSMVGPLALSIKALQPEAKIVYVYTDGGALPAGFSNSTALLRKSGIISQVITCGDAFGGDIETVNIYTGLQAARQVAKGSHILVAMGPGIAGTGTVYGFSGIEQGTALQAAHILGGSPIFVPRISFADRRKRHWGVSHHSLTILARICLCPAWLPLPLLPKGKGILIRRQTRNLPIRYRRRLLSGDFIADLARDYPGLFSTMGRGFTENREFFKALGAAAKLAVALDRSISSPRCIAIK